MNVTKFDPDAECQHCKKSKLGTFTAQANRKELSLCYKCLANLLDVFEEEISFSPTGNGHEAAR